MKSTNSFQANVVVLTPADAGEAGRFSTPLSGPLSAAPVVATFPLLFSKGREGLAVAPIVPAVPAFESFPSLSTPPWSASTFESGRNDSSVAILANPASIT